MKAQVACSIIRFNADKDILDAILPSFDSASTTDNKRVFPHSFQANKCTALAIIAIHP